MQIQRWPQDAKAQQELLARPLQQQSQVLTEAVRGIIQAVKAEGDAALRRFSLEFDRVADNPLRLSNERQQQLIAGLSDELKQAIQTAYGNIRRFHAAQLPQDIELDTQPGVTCQLKYQAIASVGLYVPGGSAPLPSTVLMLGIPAQLAGCSRVVLVTPPGQPKAGDIAAEIVYAASLCGISEIYTLGGAQAIAALAYGTDTIAPVDKIFGPGNRYVTEAKQQVSQDARGAAIDMPAGPSEVLVIADESANPVFVAADLLSQAEHGPDSQVVLVSPSEALLDAVVVELERQTTLLPRGAIAEKALANSRLILTADLATAVQVSNVYAPEHLIIQTRDDDRLLGKLTNAASIFVGPFTPESAGDYASGTNHVLPTYGYSRNHSSLSLADFYRRYTVQKLSAEGMRALGPTIVRLAKAEGLDAHANAVLFRLDVLKNQASQEDVPA
ncbi:histidinol dehydrogenase [Rheinheimera sp.]|uniref:histidinol dehydrogenase n=1 Tax=Rheinheimera sp. TaxID=1869214 RepID=UPI00307FA574